MPGVFIIVTPQVARTVGTAVIGKVKPVLCIRRDNISVEIEQMRDIFYTVRIMTDRTGSLFFNDMHFMIRKSFVG